MDRPLLYSLTNIRVFDPLKGYQDVLKGFGLLAEALFGSTDTILSKFAATATLTPSLVVNLSYGQIYQLAAIEAEPYGSLPADSTIIFQQGYAAAQQLTFNTSGLSTGQSKWALVECKFIQDDDIRDDDPTDGVLAFFNSSNPTDPLQGPGGSGNTLPTVRRGVAAVQISYGAAALTGDHVPPPVSAGCVPMYLISIAHNQTAITNGQIIVSGDTVGSPAPFAGGLNQHRHNGNPGQAAKINVLTDLNGVIPFAHLLSTSANGKLMMIRKGAADPNGTLAGAEDDFYWQTTGVMWHCDTTGPASGIGQATWSPAGPVAPLVVTSFPATITRTSGIVLLDMSADGDIFMPDAAIACDLIFRRIDTNPQVTGLLKPKVSEPGQLLNGASSVPILAQDGARFVSNPATELWYQVEQYFSQ